MKRLLAVASTLDDWMNAVAVKEFRQSVQSRGAIIILMLFLLVNLSVVGGYVMLSPDAETSIDGGRSVFLGLLGILQFTCMIVVPLYSSARMSRERNDADIDLLYVTTLTPGDIVRGKYLTAVALTLLIFSASMPFMILTYLLRGIDLPSIFFLLAMSFLICAVANALGIIAGSISGKGFFRGVGYVAFFLMFPMFPQIIVGFQVYLMSGVAGRMGTWHFWAMTGTYVLLAGLMIGLFYVLAVAILSPKPSNRMLVPRLYITGSWAVAGVVAIVWSLFETTLWPMVVWTVSSGIALMVLMLLALAERDAWSARVRRTIPRNLLLRLGAFLLYTGSAGGVAWCVLMFTATILVVHLCIWNGVVMGMSGSADLLNVCNNMPIIFGYILCYCLTTAFLRVALLRDVPTINLVIIAWFIGAAALLVPYLIAFFVERNWWSVLPWYLLGSPMVLMTDQAAKNAAGPVVIVWLVLCMLLSAPWAIGQWRRFTPYQVIAVDKAT